MVRLKWALVSMAAEKVFYGEYSNSVGGDVFSATAQAALMVGASAMGPEPIELESEPSGESEEQARARVLRRLEHVGLQIMNRTGGGGAFAQDPIANVLSDRDKRRTVAQILGQAFVAAYYLVLENREAVERVADELVERRELFGDELLHLLEAQQLRAARIDYLDERTWPKI